MRVIVSVGGKFHAFHLAKQLQKRGYLDTIFTSYPWFKLKDSGIRKQNARCLILKEILQRSLYKIVSKEFKSKISYYAAELFDKQVAGCIKPCDIFVGWSSFSLYTLRKAKSLGAVTVIERGSTHIEYQRDILKQEYDRRGIKLTSPSFRIVEKELKEYEEADYISIPSQLAKETFLNKGFPAEKLIQVPLGVDIDTFRPTTKNDRIFRIISVGASVAKGVPYILQAIAELKIKDLEFWLIGCDDGLLRSYLKKYSEEFKYLGRIPQRELYKYYSQGSISILFSLEDGFGMVLLEAMACGLPVICSTQAGAKEVVRNGIEGFIVEARNIEVLKEKILYLYENPEICKVMGQSARKRVSENFTWDDYGKRIIDKYTTLIK